MVSDTLKKAICLLHQGAASGENPAPSPRCYTVNRLRQTVTSQFPIFTAPIGHHLAPEIKKQQEDVRCCEAVLH